MKRKSLWISFLLVICLPGILVSVFPVNQQMQTVTDTTLAQITQKDQEASRIRLLHDGSVVSMDLDTYICGVLLGEMPASFPMEALKAQAVAARTYTLRKINISDRHEDADLCTDAECCQAFVFADQYTGSPNDLEKISSAVRETAGKVLTYHGQLIEATYYSCSGGRTEAAVAVWGADVPYLQAKDSPGEENAKYYRDEEVFSQELILEKLGLDPDKEQFTYSDITYTDGGGVETITICETIFTGTQLRSLLGLRSTAFSIEVNGSNVVFTTKGYGHRVGMSQYGAQAMAQEGSSYSQILSYYYPGTELVTLCYPE